MNHYVRIVIVVTALTLAACTPPSGINQVRQQNIQLKGSPQGTKTLNSQQITQCDQMIQTYYINQYTKPFTWAKVIAQTAMDTTNLYIKNSAPTVSRRVGFDVSRSVAFLTRYRGENFTGLPQSSDFICVYEVYGPGQMALQAVYTRPQFENLWGIGAVSPAQWDVSTHSIF